MTTIRVDRRDHWTTVDRVTVNDDRLSFKARGILIWLLDKPDGWRVRSKDIENAGTEGREAVRAALRELESAGYLTRSRHRDPATGQWLTESVVRESTATTGLSTESSTSDGFPSPVTRTSGSRTSLRQLSTKRSDPTASEIYAAQPLTPEQIAEKYGCQA
jgi:hypothetical protein